MSAAGVYLIALLLCSIAPPAASGVSDKSAGALRAHPERIQEIVDEFKARLGLPPRVEVAIVPRNPLMVSVASEQGREGPFVLSFEDGFLDLLSEDEVKAVVAHELGHVWIFTHHPYLQTERLANQVAMRLVCRDSLIPVYQKVWERAGTEGTLEQFLGGEAAAALNPSIAPRRP